MDKQSPRWTTVDRFDHPTDAHISAGKLESEGIPVFLHGIHHASANWLISNALGGIRLQVPAQYVDEAREILESIRESSVTETCPKCGSTTIASMNNSQKIALLAVHLFSIPLPWRKNRRHCNSCGFEWSEGED